MGSQPNDNDDESVALLQEPLLVVPQQQSILDASRFLVNKWVVLLVSATTFVLFDARYVIDYPKAFSRLYHGAESSSTIAAYALPLHLVASPVALFGGMLQVHLGVTKRTVRHKRIERLVATCMALGLIGAFLLMPLLPSRRGWHYTLILLGLAFYTTVSLLFGIYYVKKDPWRHKNFMLCTLGGWFNFCHVAMGRRIVVGGFPLGRHRCRACHAGGCRDSSGTRREKAYWYQRNNTVIDLADIDDTTS